MGSPNVYEAAGPLPMPIFFKNGARIPRLIDFSAQPVTSGFIKVTVGGFFEHRGHVGGDGIGPRITIIAGVVPHQVSEIGNKSGVRGYWEENLAQNLVGQGQAVGGVVVVNLRMEHEVGQAEGKLAAITG